jgi:hypothetical protein
LKDVAHDRGLCFVDLQPDTLRRHRIRVPKALQSPSFETAMRFLRKFFNENIVKQSVYGLQDFRLIILGVNAL